MEIGTWKAKARSGALGTTGTGKEQVAVEFEFMEGPNLGKRMTWYGFFTDGTMERTFESLRAAGWKGQDLSDLSDLGGDDVPEVSLVLEHEDYNGQTQVKIRWVNKNGGLALKNQLDPNAAKAFAAKMRGQLVAFDAKAGAPKPAAKPAQKSGDPRPDAPPLAPPGDSIPVGDIPF